MLLGARAVAAQQPVPTPPRPPADTTRRPAPAPADTTRRPVPGDTLRRPVRLDTVRTTRDSVKVAVPATPGDSTARARADSIHGIPDSLPTRKVVRDSIKAPIARAEFPTATGVGRPYRWTRDSLFATGAISALDLLERVPGLTGFRSGWLASAQTAAYLGDFRRVRVFRDGVELDAVDPRTNAIHDLADVQLWQLDEVMIEQSAGEIRLHIRSWTVRNTTPYTRVDMATGDDDTNAYRGFFGRRFGNGGALQIAAQNFGTGARNESIGGGGDGVSAFTRLGWSRGRLSIDAYASRVDRRRNATFAFNTTDTVLTDYHGRRDEGYVRVGYGDPEAGPWAQVVANALRFTLEGTGGTVIDTTFGTGGVTGFDTTVVADTARRRLQYVLAGGFTRWGVRMSATDRVRRFGERYWHAPALRAAYDRSWLSTAAYAERSDLDSLSRVDVNARLQPLPWFAVLGAFTRQVANDDSLQALDRTTSRLEVAARVGRLWASGGILRRSAATLQPPTIFSRPDSLYPEFPLPLDVYDEEAATGTLASLRGPVYKDVKLEVSGVAWDAAGLYRPQYELHAEVRLETQWLSRFKTGNFGLVVAIVDEYRSRTPFLPASPDDSTALTYTPAWNSLGALVEIRIQQATLSYQLRNALNRDYDTVPGIRAPRPLSFYGVRWNFFN